MTIFDVLSNYARSRGFMFFSLPNGTFVFGRPKTKGAAAFNIVSLKPGPQNNALTCEEVNDFSKRFSKVTVMGQRQGTDADGGDDDDDDDDAGDNGNDGDDDGGGAAAINTHAVAYDPTFPFYKPFVALNNNDSLSPALHGGCSWRRWPLTVTGSHIRRPDSHKMGGPG